MNARTRIPLAATFGLLAALSFGCNAFSPTTAQTRVIVNYGNVEIPTDVSLSVTLDVSALRQAQKHVLNATGPIVKLRAHVQGIDVPYSFEQDVDLKQCVNDTVVTTFSNLPDGKCNVSILALNAADQVVNYGTSQAVVTGSSTAAVTVHCRDANGVLPIIWDCANCSSSATNPPANISALTKVVTGFDIDAKDNVYLYALAPGLTSIVGVPSEKSGQIIKVTPGHTSSSFVPAIVATHDGAISDKTGTLYVGEYFEHTRAFNLQSGVEIGSQTNYPLFLGGIELGATQVVLDSKGALWLGGMSSADPTRGMLIVNGAVDLVNPFAAQTANPNTVHGIYQVYYPSPQSGARPAESYDPSTLLFDPLDKAIWTCAAGIAEPFDGNPYHSEPVVLLQAPGGKAGRALEVNDATSYFVTWANDSGIYLWNKGTNAVSQVPIAPALGSGQFVYKMHRDMNGDYFALVVDEPSLPNSSQHYKLVKMKYSQGSFSVIDTYLDTF